MGKIDSADLESAKTKEPTAQEAFKQAISDIEETVRDMRNKLEKAPAANCVRMHIEECLGLAREEAKLSVARQQYTDLFRDKSEDDK